MPRTAITNRRKIQSNVTSLSFNGSTAKVVFPNPTLDAINTSTMSLWALIPRNFSTVSQGLFDTNPSAVGAVRLYNDGAGNVLFDIGAGGATASVALNTLPNLYSQWSHWVVTVSGAGRNIVKLYYNGALVGGPVTQPTHGQQSTGLTVGLTNSSYFYGLIDEVVFHRNYEWTLADVQNYYYKGIIPANPFVIAHFDEGSGTTATDSSGNGNTGTITAATYSTNVPFKVRTPVSNRFKLRNMGTCLSFNGSNNVAAPTGVASNMTTAYTISAWVNRIGGYTVASNQNIFRSLFGDDLWFNFQSDGTLRIYMSAGSNPSTVSTTATPQTGGWHFAAATWDGATVKIYFDNVLIGSQAVTGPISFSSNRINVGAGAATNSLQGFIDEPTFWSRALSATELTAVMYQNVIPANGLLARYLFDEGSGTTANDASVNNNTGTITGPTYSTSVFMKPRVAIT